jgi:malate synthase
VRHGWAATVCVPIHNLMEDAATAEICGAQVWQWLWNQAKLEDGRVITPAVVPGMVSQHVEKLSKLIPEPRFLPQCACSKRRPVPSNSPSF